MSYRKLGDMVKFISNKNTDGNATVLFGINIDKFFMPSVANIIGVDLKKYKVVEKYQFACNRMHVGRDERLPISMSTFEYDFIVSPAYDVFEVISSDVLPEYLMLWFRRKEFDRQCWFYTDADVRGGLHLDALKSIEIKVPTIEEQRQFVDQYHSIENKIKVNEQICEKLEATAQALYKHWFVDFEFPNEAGKPYKSSEGKMVWNEELGKEIPERWEVKSLGEVSTCLDFKRRPLSQEERAVKIGTIPYYGAMSIVGYVDEYLYDGDFLLLSEDGANIIDENGYPAIQYVWGKFWLNNHSHIIVGKDFITIQFLYNALLKTNVSDLVTGAAQPKINQQNMNSISILTGTENIHKSFDSLIDQNYKLTKIYKDQNQKLTQLQSLLLSLLSVGEEVSA